MMPGLFVSRKLSLAAVASFVAHLGLVAMVLN